MNQKILLMAAFTAALTACQGFHSTNQTRPDAGVQADGVRTEKVTCTGTTTYSTKDADGTLHKYEEDTSNNITRTVTTSSHGSSSVSEGTGETSSTSYALDDKNNKTENTKSTYSFKSHRETHLEALTDGSTKETSTVSMDETAKDGTTLLDEKGQPVSHRQTHYSAVDIYKTDGNKTIEISASMNGAEPVKMDYITETTFADGVKIAHSWLRTPYTEKGDGFESTTQSDDSICRTTLAQ